MKNCLLIVTGLLIGLFSTFGQHSAYQAGEKVEYAIHYGVIQGGVASLELKTDTFRGKKVLHSILIGRTTGVADAVFKVKDIYESYIDMRTELPVFSIRNIREGRYRKYNEVIFDHTTRSDSAILTSDLTGVHITQPGIHDILSCFYFYRNQYLPSYDTLKQGDMLTIMTWFTDELYPIRLKFIGIEDIKTKVGRMRCLKFNPVTETGRLFKTEEDVSFWFTSDKNFLPVRIRFDIFVGAFIAEIVNYEGLKYPLEVINRKE
ncbi:MAG: DUF3108 domain-containing protein [Bacteroidales bacterium]|jgi:hypothetical protein|nr:DUF3108 domain-containing protein [Bacteroidales bacterium]